MRDRQVLVIPTNEKYKPRNMGWFEAMQFFDLSQSELEDVIEKGIEVKGAYIDEAIKFDNTIS